MSEDRRLSCMPIALASWQHALDVTICCAIEPFEAQRVREAKCKDYVLRFGRLKPRTSLTRTAFSLGCAHDNAAESTGSVSHRSFAGGRRRYKPPLTNLQRRRT